MFNLQNMELNLFFFGYCYKFCCCILFWSNKYGKKTHSFIMVSKETCDFEVFKLCICVLMYSTDPWRNSIIYGSGTWTEIHWHLNWFHALSHLVAFFSCFNCKGWKSSRWAEGECIQLQYSDTSVWHGVLIHAHTACSIIHNNNIQQSTCVRKILYK